MTQAAEEMRHRVRRGVRTLEQQVVGVEQCVDVARPRAPVGGNEPERLVLHERAADSEAELVGCEPCGRLRRRIRKLEIRLVHDVAGRAPDDVRAAARRARHLAAGELPAGDIVGVGDDAGIAYRFRRYAPRAERQAVEGDLVLVRALPGDHERIRRRVRSAEQDHPGRQRGDERGIRRVDRQAIELLATEHLLGTARRRPLVSVGVRRRANNDLAEPLARRAHLGVGLEAVLVGLTVQVENERRHPDRLERHAVSPAAVRIEQRVLPVLVRRTESRDLRLHGHHLDTRSRDGLVVRTGDLTGDDVGGRSNLSAGKGRHAERHQAKGDGKE